MPKHCFTPSFKILMSAGLLLPGLALAQIIQTLPETRVTASAEGAGAGEGDLDETTLAPEDLGRFGVETLEDLSALAPNLHFVDSDTRGYGNVISMRGLSNTLFFGPAAVGLYIDDVPFSDAYTYASNLLSLESARVHHGPQGASFGANGAAGMINLTTLQAGDSWEGSASVEYGSYDSRALTYSSSGPLANTPFSHTFQLYWKERDGFVRNRTLGGRPDDRSVLGGLGTLVWTPKEGTEVKLRVMAESVEDGGQRLTPLPESQNPFTGAIGPNPAFTGDRLTNASDLPGSNESDRYQLSLHVTRDLGWATAKSISSFQSWDLGPQIVDLDFTNSAPGQLLNPVAPIFATASSIEQRQTLRTKEFRLQSPEGAGPLAWRGGLFYMKKKNTGNTVRNFPAPDQNPANAIGFNPFEERVGFGIQQESVAAYGKVSYELDQRVAVEAGLRAEIVEARLNRAKGATLTLPAPVGDFDLPGVTLRENRQEVYVSPTAGVTYEANDNLTAFVRSGIGIKPHGYSAFSDDPAMAGFDEERNWSNEVGLQFRDEENNLNAVVRAFWNEVEDYQLNAQNPFSTDFVVVNADEVRSRGIEGELQWRPVEPLLLHGTIGFTDIEFEDYSDPFNPLVSYEGNAVPFVPEFTASAGFRYDLPGGFFIGSSVRATRDTYYDAANTESFSEGGYWVWDAQVGYEQENWSITLYGRNLLDEEYYTFINPQIGAGSPGDPQLFGVRVDLDLW